MTPIYRKDVIANIPRRWMERYDNGARGWYDSGKKAIYDALVSEGDLTAEKASAIIGNDSWVWLTCDICGKNDCNTIWRVGETPDYDARWLDICPSCIADMAEKAKDTPQ